MPKLTVRNIIEEAHRDLRARTAHNGRSADTVVRATLEEAVVRSEPLKIGSEIHRIAGEIGHVDNVETILSKARSVLWNT